MVLTFLIFSTESVYAANIADCSVQSFVGTCKNCKFNDEGGVSKECQDEWQDKGQSCVLAAYPVAAGKYLAGKLFGDGCPALQTCIDNLKSCMSYSCPDKAKVDCQNPICYQCYVKSDNCAYMAAKDCQDKSKCGDGKCDKDANEDKLTCCKDCGCQEGYECISDKCVESKKDDEEETTGKPEMNAINSDVEEDYSMWMFCLGFLTYPLTIFSMLGFVEVRSKLRK